MAIPELVIANAPFKKYPGGVIALRATDWLGAARGSLSTESDARAITGQAVRDSQKVSTSIFSNEQGAFQSAGNTLVISTASIPIEVGLRYIVMASLLIEGDWDTTNTGTTRGASNDVFNAACGFAWSLSSTFSGIYRNCTAKPRRRPHYVIGDFTTSSGTFTGAETMYFRAIGQSGTTIQYLIDQIFLVPLITSGGIFGGEWRQTDFVLAQANNSEPPDGADGGDINGKFTAHRNPHEAHFADTQTIADYQKDPLSEYIASFDAAGQLYPLKNSVTNQEASAYAYSIHGANYREAGTLTEDHFSRVTGPDDWGTTPEGFGWNMSGGPTFGSFDWSTDGSRGNITVTDAIGSISLTPSNSILKASIYSPDFIFSGIFNATAPTGGPTITAWIRLWISSRLTSRSWFVHFDLVNLQWSIYLGNDRFYSLTVTDDGIHDRRWAGPFSASWFSFLTDYRFRIEKKRYLLRVKFWDASVAEPSTWDFEGFMTMDANTSGSLSVIKNYPYDNLLSYAHKNSIQGAMQPSVGMGWTDSNVWSTSWDDIKVEYDPHGSPDGVVAEMEDANNVGVQMAIPYGAWHMVYWGSRDWTALSAGAPYADFNSKIWSDAAAAELQRCEAVFYWFRSKHAQQIAPIYWKPYHKRITRRIYKV